MLHSCTPEPNKNLVLKAFKERDSDIHVLVATIAFGMSIYCKGVHRTIHFGPSKNIESYIQESGQAGRDGEQSSLFILYQGLMLNHVNKDIKEYLKTACCRRKHLLGSFDLASQVINPSPMHLCCDICAKKCSCKSLECGVLTKFPYEQQTSSVSERSRDITEEQLDMV
ncbi:putative ATP-dependent DNA helicase Q1 [Actinia tenebrosa]|uniref:DNA 3'-5' helicase n=1 Tax=Actinia tenebrosa TaxID=6105 RepID=A0A6P8IU37_ACTTE|nr:putative ATP-dependent DNA helicase Q1 [Actinia tenebrosa]